jgi:hypothetical protein
MPNGDTMFHKMIIEGSKNIEGYIDMVEEYGIKIELVKNCKELTVIDYILRETNVEIRARIFKILQN